MTKLPENFDYNNCLDMYRSTLTAILGLVSKKKYQEAMNKCIKAVKAIDILKGK